MTNGLRGGFQTPGGGGGAGGNVEKVVFSTSHAGTIGAGLTRYLIIDDQQGEYYSTGAGNVGIIYTSRYMCTQSGTVNNLVALAEAPAGAGQSFTYTVFLNGVITAITCTVSGAVQVTNSDLVNSVAVNAGDYLTIRIVVSAAAVATYHSVSFRVSVGAERDKINYATGAAPQNATSYTFTTFRAFAASGISLVENDIRCNHVVPRAGTLRNLVVKCTTAPGSFYTYTIRINQVPTAITCTIIGAVQTMAQDLVNTAAVAAGDRVTLQVVTGINSVVTDHSISFEWRG